MQKHSADEKELCSFCGEPAEDEYSITHRECGRRTHADCLPTGGAINYKLCYACTGEQVPLASVASMDVTSTAGGNGKEPFPPDNRDYVLEPGVKVERSESAWAKVSSLFWSKPKAQQDEDLQTSQDVEFLLKRHVPVRDMLRFNKVGLQHMLKAGVTMRDFMSNGYTWDNLLLYEDIGRSGPERAQQALEALRTTATDFRLYPGRLPWQRVRDHCQMRNHDLHEKFGLDFPFDPVTRSICSLRCGDDDQWNARDCVKLGLTMKDLIGMGLTHIEQYGGLLYGLSPVEAEECEKQLQATREHVDSLLDLTAPVAVSEPKRTTPKPTKPKPVAPPVERVDDPIPHEPVQQQQPQTKVIVVQRPVPVVMQQQQPVYVSAAVAPATAKPKIAIPQVDVPRKDRFDRHGALIIK